MPERDLVGQHYAPGACEAQKVRRQTSRSRSKAGAANRPARITAAAREIPSKPRTLRLVREARASAAPIPSRVDANRDICSRWCSRRLEDSLNLDREAPEVRSFELISILSDISGRKISEFGTVRPRVQIPGPDQCSELEFVSLGLNSTRFDGLTGFSRARSISIAPAKGPRCSSSCGNPRT